MKALKPLKTMVDMILPPRCIVTGDLVGAQGAISGAAFRGLDFVGAPFCDACGLPFTFEAEAGALCTACLTERPVFGCARAAVIYNDASRTMILGFKHGDKMHAVAAFTPWMLRAGQEVIAAADIIVPVPLHRRRLLARRYNQAMVLAAAVARSSGKEVIPDLLARVRATPSQGHLKVKERQKNVARAFAVRARYKDLIAGKNVVLIDDVYTTGATVKECAKVLMAAGTACVNVLTLARVSRFENF